MTCRVSMPGKKMSACPILSQNENSSNWTQDITARCITTAFQVTTASSNTSLGVHQAHGQSIFPNILHPSLVFLALLITRKSLKKQHPLDVCKLDILVPLRGYSPKCCGSFHDRSTKQRSPAGKGGLHGPGAVTKNGVVHLYRLSFFSTMVDEW